MNQQNPNALQLGFSDTLEVPCYYIIRCSLFLPVGSPAERGRNDLFSLLLKMKVIFRYIPALVSSFYYRCHVRVSEWVSNCCLQTVSWSKRETLLCIRRCPYECAGFCLCVWVRVCVMRETVWKSWLFDSLMQTERKKKASPFLPWLTDFRKKKCREQAAKLLFLHPYVQACLKKSPCRCNAGSGQKSWHEWSPPC